MELEATMQLQEARQEARGLAGEYPRTDRPLVEPLTAALQAVEGLKAVQARVVAQSLKRLADKGHDLDEIVRRMLRQKKNPAAVAELVLAAQVVTEQICSYAEALGDRLYDVFDRAKGLK